MKGLALIQVHVHYHLHTSLYRPCPLCRVPRPVCRSAAAGWRLAETQRLEARARAPLSPPWTPYGRPRGPVWGVDPCWAPAPPPCFLVFVFSRPPTASDPSGPALPERSKTLGPADVRLRWQDTSGRLDCNYRHKDRR